MYIGILPPERFKEDHHITITFNGHGESKQDYLKAVIALAETAQWWHANGNGRIQIEFGETARFGDFCTYSKVISTKLPRFRTALVQNLDRHEVYHSEDYEYTPHLTLAYGKDQASVTNPYEGQRFSVPTLSIISTAFGTTNIQV